MQNKDEKTIGKKHQKYQFWDGFGEGFGRGWGGFGQTKKDMKKKLKKGGGGTTRTGGRGSPRR